MPIASELTSTPQYCVGVQGPSARGPMRVPRVGSAVDAWIYAFTAYYQKS